MIQDDQPRCLNQTTRELPIIACVPSACIDIYNAANVNNFATQVHSLLFCRSRWLWTITKGFVDRWKVDLKLDSLTREWVVLLLFMLLR